MAYYGGSMIGALLAMMVLSFILEWALFKRVMDDPVAGKVGSLIFALVLASIIFMLNGNPNTAALLFYGAAALLLLPCKIWRGMGTRARLEEPDEALGEVFD